VSEGVIVSEGVPVHCMWGSCTYAHVIGEGIGGWLHYEHERPPVSTARMQMPSERESDINALPNTHEKRGEVPR
jgi:hypothetical protein